MATNPIPEGTKNMTVNVPKKLYAELEQLTKASGLKSVGAYARAVLIDAVKNHDLVLNETTVQRRPRRWGKEDEARIEQLLSGAKNWPAIARQQLKKAMEEGDRKTLSNLLGIFGPQDFDLEPVNWPFHAPELPFSPTKNPRTPRT